MKIFQNYLRTIDKIILKKLNNYQHHSDLTIEVKRLGLKLFLCTILEMYILYSTTCNTATYSYYIHYLFRYYFIG